MEGPGQARPGQGRGGGDSPSFRFRYPTLWPAPPAFVLHLTHLSYGCHSLLLNLSALFSLPLLCFDLLFLFSLLHPPFFFPCPSYRLSNAQLRCLHSFDRVFERLLILTHTRQRRSPIAYFVRLPVAVLISHPSSTSFASFKQSLSLTQFHSFGCFHQPASRPPLPWTSSEPAFSFQQSIRDLLTRSSSICSVKSHRKPKLQVVTHRPHTAYPAPKHSSARQYDCQERCYSRRHRRSPGAGHGLQLSPSSSPPGREACHLHRLGGRLGDCLCHRW